MSPKSNMRGFHEINEELYKLSKNEDKAITHEDIKILYTKLDNCIWDTMLDTNEDIKYRIGIIETVSFEKGLEIGRGCPDAKRVARQQAFLNTNLRELNIILETTDDPEEDSE